MKFRMREVEAIQFHSEDCSEGHLPTAIVAFLGADQARFGLFSNNGKWALIGRSRPQLPSGTYDIRIYDGEWLIKRVDAIYTKLTDDDFYLNFEPVE